MSGGDLRKAVTTLQSAVRLGGPAVTRQAVLDVSGQVPPEVISTLLRTCRGGSHTAVQQQVRGGVRARAWRLPAARRRRRCSARRLSAAPARLSAR